MSDHLFSPHLMTYFFGRENISKEEEKKKGLILSQLDPTPTSRLGTLTPDNRMAWKKKKQGCGNVKRIYVFIRSSPPNTCTVCEKFACCVSCRQWVLAPGAGRSIWGVMGPSQAKQDWSSPSLKGQTTPGAASHNMCLSHTSSFPFLLSFDSRSPPFLFPFGKAQ